MCFIPNKLLLNQCSQCWPAGVAQW